MPWPTDYEHASATHFERAVGLGACLVRSNLGLQ
jgi:hypothetical protein